MASGAITRNGPLVFLKKNRNYESNFAKFQCCQRYTYSTFFKCASMANACNVFPSPISSANIPLRPLPHRAMSQFKPFNWKSYIFSFMKHGVWSYWSKADDPPSTFHRLFILKSDNCFDVIVADYVWLRFTLESLTYREWVLPVPKSCTTVFFATFCAHFQLNFSTFPLRLKNIPNDYHSYSFVPL